MKSLFAGCMAVVSLTAVACNPPRSAHEAEAGEHATRSEPAEQEEAPDPRLQQPAALVKILPNDLECTSEVLGLVDVHEPVKSAAEGLELLRRRAALLGAEAVVGVELEHGEGGHEKTHLSGTAVKCNDLLRGRKFDVIAKIQATAEMEHEEDALASLKSQARAKGANLILEVHFEHGEGNRTKITGTAVHAY